MEVKKYRQLTQEEKERIETLVNSSYQIKKILEELKEKTIKLEFIIENKKLFKCINCQTEKEKEFKNCYGLKVKIGQYSFELLSIDEVLGCIEDKQSLKDIAGNIVSLIEREWQRLNQKSKNRAKIKQFLKYERI